MGSHVQLDPGSGHRGWGPRDPWVVEASHSETCRVCEMVGGALDPVDSLEGATSEDPRPGQGPWGLAPLERVEL